MNLKVKSSLTNNYYIVYDNDGRVDADGYPDALFTGTLSDCEAFIRLTEQGKI